MVGGLILLAGCGTSASTSSSAGKKSPAPPAPTAGTVTKTVTPSAPATATPPTDFASDYSAESNGVVRITESTCAGPEQGSGFLVAPNLVATAAHVVSGETALSIVDPVSGAATPGQVVGFNADNDVALVRTQAALTGHVFTFAGAAPQVGSRLAAIGYPLDGPESIAEGSVSGLDRTITVRGGQTLAGLIQTDTPLNPGNSGGPMIALDGTVIGIADAGNTDAQGINFAVPAGQAAPLVSMWKQNPVTVPAAVCQGPAPQSPSPSPVPSPSPSQPPSSAAPSAAIDSAIASLKQYITLVNAQDFVDAYALLTPAGQHRAGSESRWAQGLAGSSYTNVQVVGFTNLSGGGFDVELTFTSTQPGQSCKNWDLDYRMLPGPSGGYLIDAALPHGGGSGFTLC